MAAHNSNNNDTNNTISSISHEKIDSLTLDKVDLYGNKIALLHPRSKRKDEIVLNLVCGNVSGSSIGTRSSSVSCKKARPNPSSATTLGACEEQLLQQQTLGSVSTKQKQPQQRVQGSVASSTSEDVDDEEETKHGDEKKIDMSSTSVHGEPPEGLECLCTMEDITLELGNFVEYQTFPSLTWHPAKYEQAVVVQLLETQFTSFVDRVKTTDCQAELRRLLGAGPPVYISDKHAMPLPDNGDTHICQLWYASDNQERSAKLKDAVEGDERQALWDELKQFIIVEGKEPGDDDGDGDGEADTGEATHDENE